MTEAIVEVYSLTKRFGRFSAVDGIRFRVEQGERFGFLGPNRSEKTTTIAMLSGVLRPTAGTVIVGGIDVVRRPLEAKRLHRPRAAGDRPVSDAFGRRKPAILGCNVRSERNARLFELAQSLGKRYGLDLTEAKAGGGSDGNFTAGNWRSGSIGFHAGMAVI